MDVASLPISPLLIFPLMVVGVVVLALSTSLVFKHINRMIYRYGGEWALLWGVAVVLCVRVVWAVVQ
jgi:uncharacterized YccA/Bax inhibitor family protein